MREICCYYLKFDVFDLNIKFIILFENLKWCCFILIYGIIFNVYLCSLF